MFYLKCINELSKETDSIILFHSGTGKDSIMLLDLLSPKFKKVFCVFMYIVPGLQYENKYINWALQKYKNCEFIKTPHYCLNSFIKNGYLGIKKDTNIIKNSISKIDQKIRKITGINYSVYGFKKIDGITRRLMLTDKTMYKDNSKLIELPFNRSTKKSYPLADLKNHDVLNYIKENNLIPPFNYGTLKPSSGCDISTPEFLDFLSKKYPNDLKKIFKQFPFCEAKLFEFQNR